MSSRGGIKVLKKGKKKKTSIRKGIRTKNSNPKTIRKRGRKDNNKSQHHTTNTELGLSLLQRNDSKRDNPEKNKRAKQVQESNNAEPRSLYCPKTVLLCQPDDALLNVKKTASKHRFRFRSEINVARAMMKEKKAATKYQFLSRGRARLRMPEKPLPMLFLFPHCSCFCFV